MHRVCLLPCVPLVQRRAVPCQMQVQAVQARGALDGCVHVDEFLVGEQTARRRLALDLPDRDLTWADTSRGGHGSDKGDSDRILWVVEAGRGSVERDHCRYLLRVRALEACITPAVQQRGASGRGDCVDGARLDAGRVWAVGVGLAQRTVS